MGKYKQAFGDIGEEFAAAYLQKEKYKILERKYTAHKGEIDIIALRRGVTVFVEVKTRSGSGYGSAADAVDFRKRQKLIETATRYIAEKNPKTSFRFDVIEVYGKYIAGEFLTEKIEHIENAFGVNWI